MSYKGWNNPKHCLSNTNDEEALSNTNYDYLNKRQ